ncbi:OprD family outer membrane porin, partial [Pseudomonas savastanoi]
MIARNSYFTIARHLPAFHYRSQLHDSITTKKVCSMRANSSCKLLCGLSAAIAANLTPISGNAAGFVEDAKVNLNLRNFYINRNFVDPANAQNYAEEWTQNFILDARSGFTQGTVGFGVDALGLYSLKLDGGKGTGGTQLLPIHS